MKLMPLICFLTITMTCLGQEHIPFIRIQGTVYSPDSIPVENAYLLSYKTLRAYATDKSGYFDILIQADDSLKLNHLSYKQVNISVADYTGPLTIYMEYEENSIGEVSVKLYNRLTAIQYGDEPDPFGWIEIID